MANQADLGRLEHVELREAWTNEARDFTPWLAKDDNIALLADAIGTSLDVVSQEKDVGPYRADILCKDESGHWVLIENQLERTDHIHLGQLITYAAGLDAVTIVWVARRFTDEHRAALDWLNEITPERMGFFGIEIELWRIGNSKTAPKFNVVSRPNDWTKPDGTARRHLSNSPTEETYLEYWRSFGELIDSRGGAYRPVKPRAQHWYGDLGLGRTGFHLSPVALKKDGIIRMDFVLTGADAKSQFQQLLEQKDTIEAEAETELLWHERPNFQRSKVELASKGDPNDRDQWPEQHKWLYDKLQLFHRLFADRIKNL